MLRAWRLEHRPGSNRLKVCWKCGADVADGHRFCMQCGADQTRPAGGADPLVGRTLANKYRIEAPIGSGAMGTIYRAEQMALAKTIVIKVLHKHLMGDQELLQRFEREARAASRLNHPNCVQIIDFGSLPDGALYIAMEFIAGIDLADLIEREYPIDHLRVVRIAKQICIALDEAHANGVLHRDLKPENIMLEDRRNSPDHVKVVDFGIAKLDEANPDSKRAFQTRAGIVCGTPEYMSPEQARGERLDARSDIYALGVLLYHVVTDRLPFEGQSPIETVTMHLSEAPLPPQQHRPDLPEPFAALILTMLAKNREHRPPSAMDVHAELERIERELLLLAVQTDGQSSGDKTAVDIRPISALIDLIDLQATTGQGSGSVSIKDTVPDRPRGPPPAPPRTLSGMKASSPAPDPQSNRTDELDRDAVTHLGARPVRPRRQVGPGRPPTGEHLQELDTVMETEAIRASSKLPDRNPSSVVVRRSGRDTPAGPVSTLSVMPARTDGGPDATLAQSSITHQALPNPDEALRTRTGLWVVVGLLLTGGVVAAILVATS